MSEQVNTREKATVSPRTSPRASAAAICIQPIGTDLVAATAFDTLARKMGYGEVLESLWRETLWILSFDCEPGMAAGLTASLAENTGIFVNPNTHRHAVVIPGSSIPHGRGDGREALGVVVWSYDDPQTGPVEAAVRERMGVTELTALRRMTLWWPGFLKESMGGRPAADIALSMVATRSRNEGLLANPHYEGWYLVESPHTPAMMLDAVGQVETRVDTPGS